jgi:hypothetical protein
MKVTRTTTFIDVDCHKQAARAIKAGRAVFGLGTPVAVRTIGVWLVNRFPTTVEQPARLSGRGVYVTAPGGLTEQYLAPTKDSGLHVTWTLDGCMVPDAEPDTIECPAHGAETVRIELDPDNPDGDPPPEGA